MLPTNPSSSVQRRRQIHRRQQSLEGGPVLAAPLPPTTRRTNAGRTSHRRGLSLDTLNSSGFRPLQPDTPGQPLGNTTRTQPDTNISINNDQQHFIKQEPQEHSLAQPGYPPPPPPPLAQARDFQAHLQQQLNGIFSQPFAHPEQVAAMQSLQSHMMWYQQNFGSASADPNVQAASFVHGTQLGHGEVDASGFVSHPPPSTMPPTTSTPGHSQTVPNTPQHYAVGWPSPPPSHMKHARSQSYQLDVAPMQQLLENVNVAFQGQAGSFNSHPYGLGGHQDYDPSVYSSSVADPSSPAPAHGTPLPTLYEEAPARRQTHPQASADALLLHAAAGAELDFNSPHFVVGGRAVCPEQAALDAAGIDATYIETGVSEEEINSYLINPTKKGDAYICKFEDCDVKVNRKENARSHVQNHLNDRKFRCNPCGKRFTRMHDTKRHFLTHTNERPAVCPCGRSFARADALTRHRQRDMCEGVLPGFEKTDEDRPKRGRPKKDRSGEVDAATRRTTRPDMETRAQKAAMARGMDKAGASQVHPAHSDSSARSERSLPDTPPQDSDAMDTADFLAMNAAEAQFHAAARSWLDTPPTSPPSVSPSHSAHANKMVVDLSQDDSISPSKLSVVGSSPVATGVADKGWANLAASAAPAPAGGFVGVSSPIDDPDDEGLFTDAVNFDVMDSHPDVSGHGVFSPPGESCSGSSVYNSDFDTVYVSHRHAPAPVKVANVEVLAPTPSAAAIRRSGFVDGSDDDFLGYGLPGGPDDPAYDNVRDLLDYWISTH